MIPISSMSSLSLSLKRYLTKQSGILTIHSLGKCGANKPCNNALAASEVAGCE